jgi:hypothetical protein
MWRIHWKFEEYYTFDTQQELIDWVNVTAGVDKWRNHPFQIQEQINGEWTAPSVPTSF